MIYGSLIECSDVLSYSAAGSLSSAWRLPAAGVPSFLYLFDLYNLIRSLRGDLRHQNAAFPCSEGGSRLPGGVEQCADHRWAIDLARVGVDPAVVHRSLSDEVELLRLDSNVAQAGRQTESRNQGGDHIGSR